MRNTIIIALTVDQLELAMIAARRLSPKCYEHQRKGNPLTASVPGSPEAGPGRRPRPAPPPSRETFPAGHLGVCLLVGVLVIISTLRRH